MLSNIVKKINKYKEKRKRLLHFQEKLKPLGIPSREIRRVFKAKDKAIQTQLFGSTLTVNSAFWYLHGLEELFIDNSYLFHSENINPVIIDCGANTGLSAIYFKKRFPKAQVTAFEPDAEIFALLQKNLNTFGYADVENVNKAIWTHDEGINFIASGGVGGRMTEDDAVKSVNLPSFRLRNLLDREIDFLKVDIEGAEYEVIKDCADKLVNVKNLFIEYHSEEKNEQKLDEILRIVREAGFKYYIKEAWNNQPAPFTNKRENLFDLQLNIFCYRV